MQPQIPLFSLWHVWIKVHLKRPDFLKSPLLLKKVKVFLEVWKWGKILKGFFTLYWLSYSVHHKGREPPYNPCLICWCGKKIVESTFEGATESLWEISVVPSAAELHSNFPFLSRRAVLPSSLHPGCPAALLPASPEPAESTNWFCHPQKPAATSTAPKSLSFFKWFWAGRHIWAVSVQLCTVTVMYHAEGNLKRFQD